MQKNARLIIEDKMLVYLRNVRHLTYVQGARCRSFLDCHMTSAQLTNVRIVDTPIIDSQVTKKTHTMFLNALVKALHDTAGEMHVLDGAKG